MLSLLSLFAIGLPSRPLHLIFTALLLGFFRLFPRKVRCPAGSEKQMTRNQNKKSPGIPFEFSPKFMLQLWFCFGFSLLMVLKMISGSLINSKFDYIYLFPRFSL